MIDRRTALAGVAGMFGAALYAPIARAAGLAQQPAAGIPPISEGPPSAPVFTPAQRALMTALSERVLPTTDTPGAIAADVPAFIEKLLATFMAMLSGIPGGFFAPSLSVGTALGSTVADMIGASIGLGAILGMAGYFSGVTQAPMTTFVIILEMTGNHRCIFPIMAASMLGYLASRIIMPEQFYHGMARIFVANVIRTRRAGHAPEH